MTDRDELADLDDRFGNPGGTGVAFQPSSASGLAAGPVVDKEYVRAMVGFITTTGPPFEPITGCEHHGGRCRGLRLTSP